MSDWEDATTRLLTGAPFWRFAKRGGIAGPIVLGFALFVLVVAMVLFAPSADSHFIYTDF